MGPTTAPACPTASASPGAAGATTSAGWPACRWWRRRARGSTIPSPPTSSARRSRTPRSCPCPRWSPAPSPRRSDCATPGLRDTGFSVTEPARLVTPYANQARGPPIQLTDGIVVPFGASGVVFAPSRILHAASYPSGGTGAVGTARDYLRFLEAVRTARAGLAPATHAAALQDQLAGADASELGPGKGFSFLGAVILDPAAVGTPVSSGTVLWGGAYGHTWWIDPAAKLSVVLLTNTAFEGTFGRLVGDLQHAIYGR